MPVADMQPVPVLTQHAARTATRVSASQPRFVPHWLSLTSSEALVDHGHHACAGLPSPPRRPGTSGLYCLAHPNHVTLCPAMRGVTGKGTPMTQPHEVTADAHTAGRPLTTLPGPRGWPLVGNLFQLTMPQLHTILEHWADTYGPFYTFRLGRKPVVVLAAPDLIQTVLRHRPETFRRLGAIAHVLEDVGANGLFAAEGTAWRRQRRVVMPAVSLP